MCVGTEAVAEDAESVWNDTTAGKVVSVAAVADGQVVLTATAVAQALTASMTSDAQDTSSKDDPIADKYNMVPQHPWATEVEPVLMKSILGCRTIFGSAVNKGRAMTVGC